MKNNKRPHDRIGRSNYLEKKLDITCSSCFSLVVIFHSVVDDMSTSTIVCMHICIWIMDGGWWLLWVEVEGSYRCGFSSRYVIPSGHDGESNVMSKSGPPIDHPLQAIVSFFFMLYGYGQHTRKIYCNATPLFVTTVHTIQSIHKSIIHDKKRKKRNNNRCLLEPHHTSTWPNATQPMDTLQSSLPNNVNRN